MTIAASETINKVCVECNRRYTGAEAQCPHDGSLLIVIQEDPLVGTLLAGAYEIISIIGHGGMGVVYKARHAMMDRIVAIKMLKSQLMSDSMSVRRFQQEVKASSKINHPHVVSVFNFGISPQGSPYIVMDYLEGTSLANLIAREGQLGVERGIKIISQACEGLAFAHKQGVVHRDLKPGNLVLINYDGDPEFVKIVDFGVAKLMGASADTQRLTQQGDICGSPVYMSPEQCMGKELDFRSDIYSMGVLIYETLTGHLPLIGLSMVDTMSKHVSEMPPPFSAVRPDLYIPERIQQVVFKAMAKDVNDRHQSMDELRKELEQAIPRAGRAGVLRSSEAAATTAEKPLDTKSGSTQRPTIIIACSVVAILVLVVAFFLLKPGAHNPSNSVTKITPVPGVMPKTTAPATDEKINTNGDTVKAVTLPAVPSTHTVHTGVKPGISTQSTPGSGLQTPSDTSTSTVQASKPIIEPRVSKDVIHKPIASQPTKVRLPHVVSKISAPVSAPVRAPKPAVAASKKAKWDSLRSELNN